MTPSAGIEPGTHRWKASALTTTPTLLPLFCRLFFNNGIVQYSYIFFFYNNIVFPAQAEYSYFSVDSRLKILLCVLLDYSVWHFRFRLCFSLNTFSWLLDYSVWHFHFRLCFSLNTFSWFCRLEKGRTSHGLVSYKNTSVVLCLHIYATQNYILFQTSASGLFLKFREYQPGYSYI